MEKKNVREMNRYSLKVVNNDRNRMMTDTFVPEVLTLSLGWSANFSGFGFCFHLISALSFAYCDLEKNDCFSVCSSERLGEEVMN